MEHPSTMADSAFVVTLTATNFQEVVIEGSYQRPVLVDFWADWCGPCRALMPVLGKLVEEYGGKFLLGKLDTEAERELAAQFGIRSLPTVQLFKDGKAVDQFMGALPEAQVRAFLDRFIPREADLLIARAEALIDSGDLTGGAELIAKARAAEPNHPGARIAEIRLRAASGDTQAAEELIQALPVDLAGDPAVLSLSGQLRFANALAGAAPAQELEARLAADPMDSEARYQLAAHHVTSGDYDGALDLLFELMRHDRAYGDDAGRKGMLLIFDLLGGSGDLVARWRSKMFAAMH
jgi:putative thioredoxin